jgi:hypothetical protein
MAKHFDITVKQLPTPVYPKGAGYVLRPHQLKEYASKAHQLRAMIAAGGSGKTVTQEACAIREMRESGYLQRQLITAPQSQICNQFAAHTPLRLECTEKCFSKKTSAFTCDHPVTKWHVRPTFNLADDTSTSVLNRLEAFVMRPISEQKSLAAKLKAAKTFEGLVLVTTHAAITRVFNERILPKMNGIATAIPDFSLGKGAD